MVKGGARHSPNASSSANVDKLSDQLDRPDILHSHSHSHRQKYANEFKIESATHLALTGSKNKLI